MVHLHRSTIVAIPGNEYAVKIVSNRNHPNREVQILKLCQGHPNIVKLIDVQKDEVCSNSFSYFPLNMLARGGELLSPPPFYPPFTSPILLLLSPVYLTISFNQLHTYIVLELVKGGELLDRLRRKKSFTEGEAMKIVRQIVSALKFLHSRCIVHRDLKPEVCQLLNIIC